MALFNKDMIKKNKFILVIYLLIMLSIISLQIYALFYAMPLERRIFEECNLKTLCLNGYLYGDVCHGYKIDQNKTFNWTI